MMGIVVDDGHPATVPTDLESARDSGKVGARRGQDIELETELETHCDRGEGVEGIEVPGHRQRHIAELAVLPED